MSVRWPCGSLASKSNLVWLVMAIVAAASMWAYVLIVWPESATRLSDLYPRWYGSRELLLHDRNPYSSDVSREIQVWQRGRPALAGEDEGRFAYPLYVAFLLAPTIRAGFDAVNTAIFWVLLVLTAVSLFLYYRLLNWFPPPMLSLAILLFTLGSFPVGLGLRLRQLSLLSGFLLAASLVLIVCERYSLAGVLLALATIKPQLTFLVVAWLLMWSVSEWRSRQSFVWSFAGSMAVLFAASELLLHNWVPQFLHSTVSYLHYTDGRSILQLLFTRPGGAVLGIVVVVSVLIFCASYRHADARSPAFAFCASIVFAATLVVIPTIAPHGQILLIPGVLFVLQHKNAIWRGGRACRMSLVGALLLLIWQWSSAFGLALVAIISGVAVARRFWVVPLSTSLLLPVAVGATLLIAAAQCVGAGGLVPNGGDEF